MLDVFHLPYDTGATDITIYTGKSLTAGVCWETWCKPRGKTMVSITLIGKGGFGGNGSLGTAGSGNAGGGGGGSGGMTSLTMPIHLLPDQLFISLAGVINTTVASYVTIAPSIVANSTLLIANSGSNGGNAAAGTAGTAGTAGSIATAATMPLGWQWANLALAGQAGGAGGGNQTAGGAAAAPTTGLRCTGGGGGGGMDSSVAASGMAGGATGTAALLLNPGGATTASATTPATRGNPGSQVGQLWFWLGGSGGAGQYNVPTGAGLQQSSGGNGNYGCGGGATGAAVVGSTAGTPGNGGPAWCSIVCW